MKHKAIFVVILLSIMSNLNMKVYNKIMNL